MADFVMSKHALERAVDMAITAEEIRDCWENPRDQHWSQKHGGWVLTRGRVTLAVKETDDLPVVSTVMWATPAGYAADAELGALDGRSTHDDMARLREVRRIKKAKGRR